jgi:hypothetical protein
MSNVVKFPAPITPIDVEARPGFSFDMTQPTAAGFVLIDACVPMALAIAFMNLIDTFNPAG